MNTDHQNISYEFDQATQSLGVQLWALPCQRIYFCDDSGEITIGPSDPFFFRLDWEWEIGRGWLSRGPTTLWTWSTTFSGWRKSSNWLKQRRGKIEDLRFWATSLLSGGDWTKRWWPEVFWEPISALSPQPPLSGTTWLSPLWPLLPRSHLLYHATRETRERVIVPQKSQLARIASGGTSTQTRSLG